MFIVSSQFFTRQLALVSLAVWITALTGCGAVTEDVSDEQLAEDLLNRGQFEEAKTILRGVHTREPGNDRVTVMLASAYAGAAGINLFDSWPLFETLLNKKEAQVQLTAEAPQPGSMSSPGATNDFEKESFKFLTSLATGFKVLGKIPLLDRSKRSDLDLSISLLGQVDRGQQRFARAKLYSSLLNVFQFSSLLREGFPAITANEDYNLESIICNLNPTAFLETLEMSLGYLSAAVKDGSIATENTEIGKKINLSKLEGNLATLVTLQKKTSDQAAAILAAKSAFNSTLCSR